MQKGKFQKLFLNWYPLLFLIWHVIVLTVVAIWSDFSFSVWTTKLEDRYIAGTPDVSPLLANFKQMFIAATMLCVSSSLAILLQSVTLLRQRFKCDLKNHYRMLAVLSNISHVIALAFAIYSYCCLEDSALGMNRVPDTSDWSVNEWQHEWSKMRFKVVHQLMTLVRYNQRLANFVDWFQVRYQCCGFYGWRDWDKFKGRLTPNVPVRPAQYSPASSCCLAGMRDKCDQNATVISADDESSDYLITQRCAEKFNQWVSVNFFKYKWLGRFLLFLLWLDWACVVYTTWDQFDATFADDDLVDPVATENGDFIVSVEHDETAADDSLATDPGAAPSDE